jgi:hypothetical protein
MASHFQLMPWCTATGCYWPRAEHDDSQQMPLELKLISIPFGLGNSAEKENRKIPLKPKGFKSI